MVSPHQELARLCHARLASHTFDHLHRCRASSNRIGRSGVGSREVEGTAGEEDDHQPDSVSCTPELLTGLPVSSAKSYTLTLGVQSFLGRCEGAPSPSIRCADGHANAYFCSTTCVENRACGMRTFTISWHAFLGKNGRYRDRSSKPTYFSGRCDRYSFPSSVAGDLAAEQRDRADLLGIWRAPGPDGSTFLPYEGVPSRTPGAGAETPGTMLSGSTCFAPGTRGSTSSKGMDTDIELGLGERKHSKFTLLPASNPPRQDLYHFAPIFKVFRVSAVYPRTSIDGS